MRTPLWDVATCRVCGCTDDDCSRCVAQTGIPCMWEEEDLCSACVLEPVVRRYQSWKPTLDRLVELLGGDVVMDIMDRGDLMCVMAQVAFDDWCFAVQGVFEWYREHPRVTGTATLRAGR